MKVGPDVILVKGAPGTGKSQVSRRLAKSFPGGVRMEVDNLRKMVISVEWTNQIEHKNLLMVAARLTHEFLELGFSPVFIVDTFSGDKIGGFLNEIIKLRSHCEFKIFALYASDEVLKQRLELRGSNEFKDFDASAKINADVLKMRHPAETQIDTSGTLPDDVAKSIIQELLG